jgi:hypothetical protein
LWPVFKRSVMAAFGCSLTLHTKRLYRLYDFSKAQIITSDQIWCVSGKVNSADKLYLVIETVKTDAKNRI